MKASFVSLFALAAGAFAGTVSTVEQTVTISKLTETVQQYTLQINKTVAAVPENPTTAQVTAAVSSLTPQVEKITDVLHLAIKSSTLDTFLDVDGSDLLELVEGLVYEIVNTVNGIIVKLGLVSGVLAILQPLFIVLGALVRSLAATIDGLLVDVEGILNAVLGAVSTTLTTLL